MSAVIHLATELNCDAERTFFAGSTTSGYTDATGTSARFADMWGLEFDPSGNLYVSEPSPSQIRKITPAGVVSTYRSSLSFPAGLAFDRAGNLYFSNMYDQSICMLTPGGTLSTLVHFTGYPYAGGVAVNPSNNDVYVGARNYNQISLIH